MPFGNEEESEEMKETVLHVAAANFTTSHSSSTKQMQFAYFEKFETAIFFFGAENKSKCSHLKISSQNKGKRSCPPRK